MTVPHSNNGSHRPAAQPDPAWHRAVQLAGEAIYQQPRFRPSINHGMELALEHAVMPHPDDTAAVLDNGIRFSVSPDQNECDCDYPGFGSSLCSHLAAVAIHDYAQRHLACKLQPADALQAQGPAFGWPDSTLCIKSSLPGIELSWTLRGDDHEVAERAQRVLRYVERLHEKPALCQPAAEPPASVAPEPAVHPSWCPIHQVNMKQRSRGGESWYSHKAGDDWCRGAAAS